VSVNEKLTAEEWKRRYEREKEKVSRLRGKLERAEEELERWRKGETVSAEEQVALRDESDMPTPNDSCCAPPPGSYDPKFGTDIASSASKSKTLYPTGRFPASESRNGPCSSGLVEPIPFSLASCSRPSLIRSHSSHSLDSRSSFNLAEEIEQMQTEAESRREEIQQLSKARQELQMELQKTELNAAELKNNLDREIAARQDLELATKDLNITLSKRNNDIDGLKSSLEGITAERDEMELTAKHSKIELERKEKDIANQKEENFNLAEEIEQMQTEAESRREEIQQLSMARQLLQMELQKTELNAIELKNNLDREIAARQYQSPKIHRIIKLEEDKLKLKKEILTLRLELMTSKQMTAQLERERSGAQKSGFKQDKQEDSEK